MPSNETPSRAQLSAILEIPEAEIPDEAVTYATIQHDPDAVHLRSISAKAAEVALDKVAPAFPKEQLHQYFEEQRKSRAALQAEEAEAAALARITEMNAERELLSPKSRKFFDEVATEEWWDKQDSKVRANRKNLEIAAAAAAQVTLIHSPAQPRIHVTTV